MTGGRKRTILFLCAVLAAGLTGCSSGESGISPWEAELLGGAGELLCEMAAALIGVAGAWAAAKLAQRLKLLSLREAVEQVTTAAQQTVWELKQTTVDGLKAAAADGKLTQAEKEALGEELLHRTQEKLTAPCVALLRAAGSDLGALIRGAAEAALAEGGSAKTGK